MMFFKSAFSRLSNKPAAVAMNDMALDSWCRIDGTDSTRSVQKVEMCTALSSCQNAKSHTPVDKSHYHTFLRVTLSPNSSYASKDSLLVERVLSAGGEHHSVIQITPETLPNDGTFYQPHVNDRVCTVSGPSTSVAHDLAVERTVLFGNRCRLNLPEFSQILDFISRITRSIRAGKDCKFQARSFAFTCMAALTPSLPPPRIVRRDVGTIVESEAEVMDDTMFELSAEAFLAQIPWLMRDSKSEHALSLIGALKDGPGNAKVRLYH